MTDRATLILEVARLMGAQVGTVGASSQTQCVLSGLVNTTGSNESYKGMRIIFPNAPDEASKQTLIDTWTDLTGIATFAARSAFVADETYIVIARADYTLAEFRDSLATALRKSKRSERVQMPTIPGERFYPLRALTWLEGAGDVDAVYLSNSPILLQNEDYSLWQDGPNAAPDGWELDGTDAAVERTDETQRGAYAAVVTRDGHDTRLSQSLPLSLVNYYTRSRLQGLIRLRAGQWVTSSVAECAAVGIWDGSQTVVSDFHSGSGIPEWLEVQLDVVATMTAFRMDNLVVDHDAEVTFSGAVFAQSLEAIPESVKVYGSGAFTEYNAPVLTRNIGGNPTVELQSPPNAQQLIVYCRRKFAQVDSDADYIEDQYERVLEAGLAVHLLVNVKQGVDRTRYDRVLGEQSPIWATFLGNITDLPVPLPLTVDEVVSA